LIAEKIVLLSTTLIMMTALKWIIPLGALVILMVYIILEVIKYIAPKKKKKPSKPKPKNTMLIDYNGGYKRR